MTAAAPILFLVSAAIAEPLGAPGDLRLRHDLQLLNDSGVINVPLTGWPIALGDISNAMDSAKISGSGYSTKAAFERVRDHLAWELDVENVLFRAGLAASEKPRNIRGFEDTPRAEGEVTARITWLGERFAVNLSATVVANPFDSDEFRPDGTYVGVALGNWMVTAGWQDRWWGPSRDSSLILSTNARPMPGIAVQRNNSIPFRSKWLGWIGPWTFTSFMSVLDDERFVDDALLFGVRASFRPPVTGLEIGFSRTAQWCGDGRPCDADTFLKLILGKDNRGDNVAFEDEPGNQLGGFDMRWSLPKQIPIALYMQWIGEDGRPGGGLVGNWLRQVGVEYRGDVAGMSHRTHVEVSDTLGRQGGFGFSESLPNSTYQHFIYKTGYRYRGRSIGHSADGDSLSYSIGSTLVQSTGHSWDISLRYMEINREGSPNSRHTLTPTPQEITDIQISHQRLTPYGQFHAGLGYSRLDDQNSGRSTSDVTGFIHWRSH